MKRNRCPIPSAKSKEILERSWFPRKPFSSRGKPFTGAEMNWDTLESRLMLSGNVKAIFARQSLTLWGDAADNQIVLSRSPRGKLRITGLDGTRINGKSVIDASANDIRIEMRQAGEDSISVKGPLVIKGDLTIKSVAGQTVLEGSAGALKINGDVNIRNDSGNVELRNAVSVKGELNVRGAFVSTDSKPGIVPNFASANFSNPLDIDNPYFPLIPGAKITYEETSVDDETGESVVETIIIEVTNQTKTILGVPTRVVRDRAFVDGKIIEDTFDWHAQDDNGNVWYFGELSTDFEYDDQGNLIDTSTSTSWIAGENGATPGIIMLAKPTVGGAYFQEFAPGDALDHGRVLSINQTINVSGKTYSNVVQTEDTNVLAADDQENKFYAPGLGLIRELALDLQSGEVGGQSRLVSAELNGQPVTQYVSPGGFAGVNAAGKPLGAVQIGDSLSVRAEEAVLRGLRVKEKATIVADAATVVDSVLGESLRIDASDGVGLRDVEIEDDVLIRGNTDVFIFDSVFNDDVDIRLGAGDNELVIGGSSFGELFADGGAGENEFDDREGNSFAERELKRF
jgi:hypothetical protein